MTTTTDKPARPRIRVDMTELTLREQRDINRILWEEFQCSFTEALQDWRQPDAVALAVWMLRRRVDPTFTRDDALDLSMADMEMVEPAGEPPGGANGTAPASSPETGISTRKT